MDACKRAETFGAIQRRSATGMTNFSAVCVSEKLTTFTSTSPAAFPASITARSEISLRPFGRITHNAPFCFIDGFNVALLDGFADDDFAGGAAQLFDELRIAHGDHRDTPVGLDAQLFEPRPMRIIAFTVLTIRLSGHLAPS